MASGHSVGGIAALKMLIAEPKSADALIMLDSYGNPADSFVDATLPILSIYGTAHHNPERPTIFEDAKQYFPSHVNYVVIDGGDHYQFGWYQKEDIQKYNTATISAEQQNKMIVDAMQGFLDSL